jgi:hypothetical protein
MAIQLDFSDIPSNEPVPAGRYPVIVDRVECRDSKSSDSQYLNWELKVTEGEFINRRLFMMTSLSRKALWRLRAVLTNLDAYEEKLELDVDEDSGAVLQPELVGLQGVAVVKMETYQGEERSRVEELLDEDGVDRERAQRKTTKPQRSGGGRLGVVQAPVTSDEASEGEPVGARQPVNRAEMKLR